MKQHCRSKWREQLVMHSHRLTPPFPLPLPLPLPPPPLPTPTPTARNTRTATTNMCTGRQVQIYIHKHTNTPCCSHLFFFFFLPCQHTSTHFALLLFHTFLCVFFACVCFSQFSVPLLLLFLCLHLLSLPCVHCGPILNGRVDSGHSFHSIPASGSLPAPRTAHNLVALSENELCVLGGIGMCGEREREREACGGK